MKKIISLIVLLVTLYFVVADGMMTCFNLSRGIQYAFNFGAIFLLFPVATYHLLGVNVKEEDE